MSPILSRSCERGADCLTSSGASGEPNVARLARLAREKSRRDPRRRDPPTTRRFEDKHLPEPLLRAGIAQARVSYASLLIHASPPRGVAQFKTRGETGCALAP